MSKTCSAIVRERRTMVRIAAIGDIHVDEEARGRFKPHYNALGGRADVRLIAGDLTSYGTRAQAEVLAREIEGTPVPIVAVLGNHDYHRGQSAAIRTTLENAGVTVLEGESVTLELGGRTLGIAGVKGFG